MSEFWKTVIPILVAILFFEVIVFVHEFGHFFVAKLCGVKVNEFAIGMGPALFKFKKGDTLYALRLFPIGGYCAMEGENEDSDAEGSFQKAAAWKRFLIVSAGAVMNILLGLIIVLAVMSSKNYLLGSTTLAQFSEGSTSQASGLQVGDKVKSINGMKIYIDRDIFTAMALDEDGDMRFEVEREGQTLTLEHVKFQVKEENGRQSVVYDFKLYAVEKTPWKIIGHAVGETISVVRLVFLSIANLFTGRFGLGDLSGPIGTVAVISQTASLGLMNLLTLMSFITINLGVFNLLPIPALDGSKNIFLLFEMIFKKRIPQKYESVITAVGFVLLISLLIYVSVNDVMNLDRYRM